MGTELIKDILPQHTLDALLAALRDSNAQFDPFFYNLTSNNSGSMHNMAEGREGLARLVSQVALAHPEDLTRKDKPEELAARLDYDAELESLLQQTLSLHEKVKETQRANGHDIMRYVFAYRKTLEVNRSRNSALDGAMEPIDKWYKRFAPTKTKDEADEIPVSPSTPATE